MALVQSENETFHTPTHDVLTILRQQGHWDVRLYTDRTVEAALADAPGFDCVVIGVQALVQGPAIRQAVKSQPFRSNLVVLHQHSSECFDDLGFTDIRAQDVDQLQDVLSVMGRTATASAEVSRKGLAADEPLLNWPYQLIPELLPADDAKPLPLSLAFDVDSASDWIPVVSISNAEAAQAIVLRTGSNPEGHRTVITALDHEPGNTSHERFLVNCISFAATGRPSAVVLSSDGSSSMRTLAAKLELSGTDAVQLSIDPSPVAVSAAFQGWPVLSAERVFVRDSDEQLRKGIAESEAAIKWLARGGSQVSLTEDGLLGVRHGLSDPQAIAAAWAAWFTDLPRRGWVGDSDRGGSISATRAVLRVLEFCHSVASPVAPEVLGLDPPEKHRHQVEELFDRLFAGRDSLEQTVAATVSALDIDSAVGGVLTEEHRERVVAWLQAEFERSPVEDQIEIARCLGSPKLMERVLKTLPNAVSIECLTRLRFAAMAKPLTTLQMPDLQPTELGRLDDSLPLSALTLIAFARRLRNSSYAPAETDVEQLERASNSLNRHSEMRKLDSGDFAEVSAFLISTEALARAEFFAIEPTALHSLRHSERFLSLRSFENLIRETRDSRAESRMLSKENSIFRARLDRAKQTAGIAIVSIALIGFALPLALTGMSSNSLAVGAFLALGLAIALSVTLRNWLPAWAEQFVEELGQGISGVATGLLRRIGGRDSRETRVP
ncbi:MAG: hypothetical protein U0R51_12100 [Solirubrobacterales bacterium]